MSEKKKEVDQADASEKRVNNEALKSMGKGREIKGEEERWPISKA